MIDAPFGIPVDPAPTPRALLHDAERQDDQRRQAESDVISHHYEKTLESRSPQRTMSPEWVAAQPTSLKAKLRVTPEEEETILFHYASTSSVPQTASLSGVGEAKVRSVIYAPDLQTRLVELRNAMRVSVMRKIEETQTILLDALQTPSKLDSASISQISDVFAKISEMQLNLLNASRSADSLVREVDPSAIFSGDELEYMAFLRRRLSASQNPRTELSPREGSGDAFGVLESPNGHDFVDPLYDVSSSPLDFIDPVDPAETKLLSECATEILHEYDLDGQKRLSPREAEIAQVFIDAMDRP